MLELLSKEITQKNFQLLLHPKNYLDILFLFQSSVVVTFPLPLIFPVKSILFTNIFDIRETKSPKNEKNPVPPAVILFATLKFAIVIFAFDEIYCP